MEVVKAVCPTVSGSYYQEPHFEAAAGGRYGIKEKSHRDYIKSHCNGDPNGPLHNWVKIGHEERPVLWGIFGDYTKGYTLYKCTLCGATKEERV